MAERYTVALRTPGEASHRVRDRDYETTVRKIDHSRSGIGRCPHRSPRPVFPRDDSYQKASVAKVRTAFSRSVAPRRSADEITFFSTVLAQATSRQRV